jgi:hypothetical protein
MRSILEYSYSNESLDAIVAGLNVQPSDIILAIAGSGDQSFALLERAARIITVDENPLQIELVRKRAELLKKRNYREFLRAREEGHADGVFFNSYSGVFPNRKTRKKYFKARKRLDTIAERIPNLEILEPIDILKAIKGSSFSKLYLSSVLMLSTDSLPKINNLFSYLLPIKLPVGGLVYVSNNNDLTKEGREEVAMKTKEPDFLPKNIVLDRNLTQLARSKENVWRPAVYRRIG